MQLWIVAKLFDWFDILQCIFFATLYLIQQIITLKLFGFVIHFPLTSTVTGCHSYINEFVFLSVEMHFHFYTNNNSTSTSVLRFLCFFFSFGMGSALSEFCFKKKRHNIEFVTETWGCHKRRKIQVKTMELHLYRIHWCAPQILGTHRYLLFICKVFIIGLALL